MTSLLFIPVILIPLMGGFICLFIPFREKKHLHIYIESIAIITTAAALISMGLVGGEPRVLYSFAPGFELVFAADGIGKLYGVLVSLMWPLVLLYSFSYMEHEKRQRSFFGFYIMTYGATLGICFSGSPLTLFLFFEMLSVSTLPLVTYYQNHESLYTGRKYAAYLFGGAALALIAVVMATIYGESGTFRFGGDISEDAPVGWMRIIYLFGFMGFGVKAAIFPLHRWLPAASCAPTPVTALLHAVAVVNTGVFAVIRLTYYAFGQKLLAGSWVQIFAIILAAFTLLYASVVAVKERHVKRRLAYSTVSNLSYMLFGVMLLTPEGMLAGTAHLVFHSITKITLFMCIGSFMENTGKAYISDINGVGKYMPHTFICYTISALSLTGVPLLACFVSKWRLFTAGVSVGTAWAYIGIAALLISAFLCAIYSLSVSVRAFFPMNGEDHFIGMGRNGEGGWRMIVPLYVFTVCQLIMGIFPGPLLNYLTRIAEGII